jgi:hypothetical protein
MSAITDYMREMDQQMDRLERMGLGKPLVSKKESLYPVPVGHRIVNVWATSAAQAHERAEAR